MRQIAAMLLLASLTVHSARAEPRFNGWTGPKPPKPPCECRYKGGKAALGQTMCQKRGDRMVMLRCELVLNNTSWKPTGDGCDTAAMDLPRSTASRTPL